MKVLSGELKPERQLWDEIGQYCKNKLEDWAKCRNNIESLEEWLSYRKEKFEIFIKPFSSILLGEKDTLRSRLVSKYSFDGFRIENVIFESFNGWEVNATVYLPEKEGIYPGIVCPTGSSSKTLRNYQRSAQTFARNGYIAVSFDPPGFSGEKKTMNDIFKFGGRCFLTGLWTTLYTVADALRVLDYLDSREDVDSSLGYTMSGLSLGGFTTNYCSAMDDRIKFFAPVCCLKTYLQKEIIEEHTITASTFGHEYLEAGIDLTDYLCFSAPKPCLIVCGRGDEIFDVFSTSKIYNDVKHIYELYGKGGNIDFFYR